MSIRQDEDECRPTGGNIKQAASKSVPFFFRFTVPERVNMQIGAGPKLGSKCQSHTEHNSPIGRLEIVGGNNAARSHF
ncbi:hypothetical protein Ddc_04922 [Ditylenchus destructor]|nr:hypothetical protein Ddc_04922 [Ditylenchus destructor]